MADDKFIQLVENGDSAGAIRRAGELYLADVLRRATDAEIITKDQRNQIIALVALDA